MSGSEFVNIPAGIFEMYMMQLCANEVEIKFNAPRNRFYKGDGTVKEKVYERQITAATTGKRYPFKLRIYSGINKETDICRKAGKDAIRVVVVSTETDRIVWKSKRINRVASDNNPDTIMQRVLERCREAYKFVLNPNNHCPSCKDGVLTYRTGRYGPFYSCSNYYNKENKCSHTENARVEDELEFIQ